MAARLAADLPWPPFDPALRGWIVLHAAPAIAMRTARLPMNARSQVPLYIR
jgi:hypothetical protein